MLALALQRHHIIQNVRVRQTTRPAVVYAPDSGLADTHSTVVDGRQWSTLEAPV